MKKQILIVLLMIGTFTMASGQTRNDLKGPKAKNYKPWMNKTEIQGIKIVTSSEVDLKGPKAKNFKPWKKDRTNVGEVVVFADPKKKLMGPAAKNYKPWRD